MRIVARFADMLNHSDETEFCHVYDETRTALRITAGKDYARGDQVFINYGKVRNSRLLRLYGFVIPNNPNNTYDLVLTNEFPLTPAAPLPLDVLRYLCIQRLDPEELSKVGIASTTASKPLSARNEEEVLKSFVDAFCGLLAGFAIPAADLEGSIKEGKYSGNAYAAAVVSLDEHSILQAALEMTKNLLVGITCVKCGTADIGGKKCRRCRNAVYCSVACSKADWAEHKKVCKRVAGK
ncbi:hypothetical protein HK097_007297 [Rhizophlyctis rosea]|uniref:MYND-type domain-containing protein n=1 Tax=Rhizophlyctis rosea TaxID=64517 RepID=A0AAD5SD90_9FUNG|nr:hypothetical protein HK097_007297 [Rhizophlyctis rosea]